MRNRRYLVLALVAMLGLVAACGDDDDDTAASPSGSPGEEAARDGDFCADFLALNAGDGPPTAEQIRAVADISPASAKADMEAIAEGFEADGDAYTETEEFGERYAAVNKAAADECADERLTVTASEYKFEGIPSTIDAGIVAVDFVNKGGEFHEIAVARKKDGVDMSFDEILALDEEEAQEKVQVSFGTFAPPGTDSAALLDLREPGEYVAVCFIPVGSTPDNEEADGPPHFVQGMKSEFTVQ